MTGSPAPSTGAKPDHEPGVAFEQPTGSVDRPSSGKPRPASSRLDSRAKQRRLLLSASLLPGSPGDDPGVWGDRLGKGRGDDPDSDSMASDYLAERPPHHDR